MSRLKLDLTVFPANGRSANLVEGHGLGRVPVSGDLYAAIASRMRRGPGCWLSWPFCLRSRLSSCQTPRGSGLSRRRGRHAAALLAIVLRGLAALRGWRKARDGGRRWLALCGEDAAPCFTTDADGRDRLSQRGRRKRFGDATGRHAGGRAGRPFRQPRRGAVPAAEPGARHAGAAREDVVTRRGHTRLVGAPRRRGRFLWRLEEMLDRARPGAGPKR